MAATVEGLRIVTAKPPTGRVVGCRSTRASSSGSSGSVASSTGSARPVAATSSSSAGTSTSAPTDKDVWDPDAATWRHACQRAERAAVRALIDRGLTDTYRARPRRAGDSRGGDYRAGMFHKNFGMRIDLLLAGSDVAGRLVGRGDRSPGAKGPRGSSITPATIDLDEPASRSMAMGGGALRASRSGRGDVAEGGRPALRPTCRT